MKRHPEFPLDAGLYYLNHAAVSPWPRRSANAVKAFAEENMRNGSRNFMQWLETESRLRSQLQWLINAPSADDIALLKNTSEGLSVVAHGLEWRSGDNVVLPLQEFPSNRMVWQSLQALGVEVRLVDILADDQPEQRLIEQMDANTRLLSTSAVQYARGLRMDLVQLGGYCHGHNILFCVDAIQQLGALPFDVQECHAAVVVADAHKWMLGPEGIALFYCTADLREQLQLHQYGWHMAENLYDFDALEWQPASSARRFECGSNNMTGIHALQASMSLIQEAGIEHIAEKITQHSLYMIEQISNNPELELLSSSDARRISGIVTFRHLHREPLALHQALSAKGIVCAPRGGGIRFSPHYYNEPWELEQVFDILNGI